MIRRRSLRTRPRLFGPLVISMEGRFVLSVPQMTLKDTTALVPLALEEKQMKRENSLMRTVS
jgi:hypothetical protein